MRPLLLRSRLCPQKAACGLVPQLRRTRNSGYGSWKIKIQGAADANGTGYDEIGFVVKNANGEMHQQTNLHLMLSKRRSRCSCSR